MLYKKDLAYIHDLGFSDWAVKSAPAILEILNNYKIKQGLIIDFGCGSGLSAQAFIKAKYKVLGIDISESMIDLARKRVPEAEFRVESVFQANIPSCDVVISLGECFNYLFDSDNNYQKLIQLFHRIYQALIPGGLFIFDIVQPGQVEPGNRIKNFVEGEDWIVLVDKQENKEEKILTRRIITFRKQGEYYRRDEEVHRQQLYQATDLAAELNKIGFQVEITSRYGEFQLPPARTALIAWKPV